MAKFLIPNYANKYLLKIKANKQNQSLLRSSNVLQGFLKTYTKKPLSSFRDLKRLTTKVFF